MNKYNDDKDKAIFMVINNLTAVKATLVELEAMSLYFNKLYKNDDGDAVIPLEDFNSHINRVIKSNKEAERMMTIDYNFLMDKHKKINREENKND